MPPKRQQNRAGARCGSHQSQHSHRSMLLEDYRANRYPNLQLNEIVSHVVEFAKDCDGSKFIQRKLDDATDHRKDSIFNEMAPRSNIGIEISPRLIELMMDPFGNFVIQKFFDVGTDAHRNVLYFHVNRHFLGLALDKYGCRVVQKAIEKGTQLQQHFVLQPCIGDVILWLALDTNGNHVLQKSFRSLHPTNQHTLFERIQPYLSRLFFDLYGCRIVQCIFDTGTGEQRQQVFTEMTRDQTLTFRLIEDRYGNYVIQHALQFCAPADQNRLIEYILSNIVHFALQKYASNVVEKCLNLTSQQQRFLTTNNIINQDHTFLREFCTGMFSNYVMQNLINSATIEQLGALYTKLQPNSGSIQRHVSGRLIMKKIRERLGITHMQEQLDMQEQLEHLILSDD